MSLDYGLIGNCAYSALVRNGAVEWLCWPRMDSSFVFGHLLDDVDGGVFAIEAVGDAKVEQAYLENTNVLRTVFRTTSGAFELFDFAPRFHEYRRYFKPTMLVRILRPLEGEPVLRVRCRPTHDYGRARPERWLGSNHVEFLGLPAALRLTTDVPLTYVDGERPFVLDRDRHLVLTWGQPLEASLVETAQRFLDRTVDYWRQWVKHGRVPRDYQREVIRSALVLKLHQFDDTGAIIASTTTSIPEHPGSGRNWDYRYCWLRDAYFSVQAFELLGHTEEMESFLLYLRNVSATHGDVLQPLYAIDGETRLEESVLEHLRGFRGERPVRIGNQAYVQPQFDVYGEMILAIGRMLLDVRFSDDATRKSARLLMEKLLLQVEHHLEKPDSGLWELRGQRQVHTFTLLMHWAGAKRTAEVAEDLALPGLATRAHRIAARARELIETDCFDAERGVLVQAIGSKAVDASSLLAVLLGFWVPDDPRAKSHVAAVGRILGVEGGLLRRYDSVDDFGTMHAAFTVCTFWQAQALGLVGQVEAGRALFAKLLRLHNGLGLYSEDILPATGEQCGNFPQTYSHVGLINAAFQLSRPWE